MEAMEIEILDERVTRDGEQSFVLGISSVRRLGACLVVALALADRATGVPAERRAERQLRRWLNLNPDAWRHWPGWDAERAVAVQLRPEVCSPVASAPPVVGSG